MSDFRIAAADERTLTVGEYLLGVVLLAAIVAPIAWAAWRLRAALLPGWSGPPARVAEIIVALAALILLAQLLGTFGAFATAPMIIASFLVAGAIALASSRVDRQGISGRRRRRSGRSTREGLREALKRPGRSAREGGLREAELSGRKSQETPFAGAQPQGGLREAELSGRKSQETPFSGAQPGVQNPVPPVPPPSGGRIAITLAALACAALAAAWAIPTLISIAGGMGRADTLWYHMPLSARFVQTGSLAEIFHFDPIFLAAYYPGNSSVLHAIPILAFDRDIVSPVLNLGFLGLGLLSAWSIGRPYGLAPHALIGGAIALGAQMLVEFQGGQAFNDIVGAVLILAAAAVLVNAAAAAKPAASSAPAFRAGWRVPLAIAGLAVGLAAGMKLSFLAPAAAMLAGVVLIAGRGGRVRAAAWFGVPALIAGGYWYVRNLIAVGNPIPMVSSIGPIDLPGPERTFELRPGFSVAHYWNEPGVWVDWFFPGLAESFGDLWPLTLVAIAGAGVYALWQRGEPAIRVLGGVVLVTAVAYVVTPLTAAGEEGEPISFVWNVRYMAPAAAVGLAILPCLPALRSTPWRRAVTLIGLAALLAVTVGSLVQWQQGHLRGAVAAAAVTLAVFALVAWLRTTGRLGAGAGRGWAVAIVAVAVVGGIAGGWVGQDHHLERRYQNLSPERHLAEAVRFGADLRDARVAMSGVRGVFNQYPFYGTDLSNQVQWLGWEDEDGAYRRLPTCEDWRAALADGEYTHVVTMYDPYGPGPLTDTKEALWTREDDAARQVLRDGPVSVFELTGEPDPATCDGLPALSEPELNGDSVNRVPTANDPDFTG